MANSTSMRGTVLDAIRPKLPKAWVLLDEDVFQDSITKTTVVLKLDKIERFPQAPMHTRLVTYSLDIAQPMGKYAETIDVLDDHIMTLLDALDDIEGLAWTISQPGTVNNKTAPSYTITLSFTHTKEN